MPFGEVKNEIGLRTQVRRLHMAQPCLLVVVMWISYWQCYLQIACNWQLFLGANFLVLCFIQGYSYIVHNSVRLFTYGCWGYGAALGGELGQLRLIISTLTGALGARGYYGFRRRGSSVRWILLADNLSIWSYQRCGAGAIAVFWQLGIVILGIVILGIVILEVALTRYMENDCTTSL